MDAVIPLGLKTFIELLGDGEVPRAIKAQALGAALWVESSILHAFQFHFHESEKEILFIQVDPHLPFERILALMLALKKTRAQEVVLIADDLKPRIRSLLVRERVPFVRGDEDIFAPRLNIKLGNLSALAQMHPERIVDEISPLGLKIIAGAITGFLDPSHLKVNEVVTIIQDAGQKMAASKVSVALRELASLGLAKEIGRGPDKFLMLLPLQQLFSQLIRVPTARLFKRVMTQSHFKQGVGVYSGESALANLTEMAEPEQKTMAIYKRSTDLIAGGYGRTAIEVEVWKEDPRLFSVSGNINPIELYFSVKPHFHDSRVEKQMFKLLEEYGIKIVNA